ncbi:hypothetical protein NBRC116590_17070 [Pelagimonas sp. KU-00592-HH]|uniref:DUF5681 domain-containing protein n=1 Tax=Pelagimonas sp. KU-00592-HH TaxID=3127651 RepID=UPI00310909B2
MSKLEPYKTGYMKPPKNGQFKKGQSGNKKGRPRRQKTLYETLKSVLDRRIKVQGRDRKVPIGEALMYRLKQEALKGDRRAIALSQKIIVMAGGNKQVIEPVDVTDAIERFHQLCAENHSDENEEANND